MLDILFLLVILLVILYGLKITICWLLLKWKLVYTAISARCDKSHVYLVTNTREVYKNNQFVHAEQVLMNAYRDKNRSKVTHIWIKSSPCMQCAWDLKQFFQNCRAKPTISVGRIYDFGNDNNRALRELVNDGFKLEVWTFMHFLMHCNDKTTERHLNYIHNMHF